MKMNGLLLKISTQNFKTQIISNSIQSYIFTNVPI